MPRGNVRLFRDDFLNNHPILLEYLVEEAHDGSPLDGLNVVSQTRSKFQDDDDGENDAGDQMSATSSSFVGKMRNANPLRSATDSNNLNGTSDLNDGSGGGKEASVAFLERPMTASVSNVPTSHFCIDPSDPKTTIRKLLKHIEILMVNFVGCFDIR